MKGKNVKVRYVKKSNDYRAVLVMRDMTVGNIYDAYLPEIGEIDHYGYEVKYDDEVWIDRDDKGEKVVIQLSYGLQIV